MADTLTTVSYISFAASGIFLAIAAIVFFVFRIPSVMGDLSGRNAKKSIQRMRKDNEKTGKKSYRPSSTNAARGKITETIKNIKKPDAGGTNGGTGILRENHRTSYHDAATGLLCETTERLGEAGETAPLENTGGTKAGGVFFEWIEEVMLIHTEEKI